MGKMYARRLAAGGMKKLVETKHLSLQHGLADTSVFDQDLRMRSFRAIRSLA